MRRRHVIVIGLTTLAAGIALGVLASDTPRRRVGYANELGEDDLGLRTTLVDRCGRLIRNDDGIPVTMYIPMLPPPLDEQKYPAIAGTEPAVESPPPVVTVLAPPNSTLYAAASLTCARP